jgi:hypothetical protein
MPEYHPAFLTGEQVRVAARPSLQRFRAEWRWHHPLAEDQLDLAGQTFRVKDVSFDHGGAVLYQLQGAPGTWHEACLEDPGHIHVASPGKPVEKREEKRANTIYSIAAETRAGQPVVVVRDDGGVECLVVRRPGNELHAKQMSRVAEILTVSRFEDRYGFIGDRKRHRGEGGA